MSEIHLEVPDLELHGRCEKHLNISEFNLEKVLNGSLGGAFSYIYLISQLDKKRYEYTPPPSINVLVMPLLSVRLYVSHSYTFVRTIFRDFRQIRPFSASN